MGVIRRFIRLREWLWVSPQPVPLKKVNQISMVKSAQNIDYVK